MNETELDNQNKHMLRKLVVVALIMFALGTRLCHFTKKSVK